MNALSKNVQDRHLLQWQVLARRRALADHHMERGNYVAAERQLRRSLRLSDKVFGPEHPSSIPDLFDLGLLCHAQDKQSEAEAFLLSALRLGETEQGADHPDLPDIRAALFELYVEQDAFAMIEAG